jgi:hypothetical protein
MLQKLLLRLAELSVVLILLAAILLAWRQERADRTQLQSQLSAANQALAAATASQQSRDAKLADALTTIAAQKKAASTLTPGQLLAAIASEANLPSPLTVPQPTTSQANPTAGNQPARTPDSVPEQAAASANSPPSRGSRPPAATPANAASDLPSAPVAQIPASDLGPLYNYLLDCKACQTKLTAAQSDLADEKAKTATLSQSRDAALKAAKGGSVLQRAARALKWFAIGAAAGAIAAKAVR